MSSRYKRKRGDCVFSECDRKDVVTIRGLCERCYQAASKAVKKRMTTWEELEQKGMAKPERLSGPRPFKTKMGLAIERMIVERIE